MRDDSGFGFVGCSGKRREEWIGFWIYDEVRTKNIFGRVDARYESHVWH